MTRSADAIPRKSVAPRSLRAAASLFTRWFFPPLAAARAAVARVRGLPHFGRNLRQYSRANQRKGFGVTFRDSWYRTFDRFEDAASITHHYFHQDLWAAKKLYDAGTREHVDVGSRVDGFIAHLLTFCRVTYVDVRPLPLEWDGFSFRQGLITALPFADDSVPSLSSLHVIEHIGLGRYGDPVDPEGSWKAARELTRVLAPGGRLLVGVPTGRERLEFDAHRIFDPQTVREMFGGLELAEFSFVTDDNRFVRSASFEEARLASYGCGLFEFRKP